jgi:hypothetical protein
VLRPGAGCRFRGGQPGGRQPALSGGRHRGSGPGWIRGVAGLWHMVSRTIEQCTMHNAHRIIFPIDAVPADAHSTDAQKIIEKIKNPTVESFQSEK